MTIVERSSTLKSHARSVRFAVFVLTALIGLAQSAAFPTMIPFFSNSGMSSKPVINVTYSTSDTIGHDLYNDAKNASYANPVWDGTTPVNIKVTINSGVVIGAPSTSTPALSIPAAFPAGTTITITNNGSILGAGGNGGNGASPSSSATAGGAGGPALRARFAAIINNSLGLIAGGGGGGAGGAYGSSGGGTQYCGSGGGGGAGSIVGSGGSGGSGCNYNGTSGSPGTSTIGGYGGNYSGDTGGGNGGALGMAGAAPIANPPACGSGCRSSSTPGVAGNSIDGASYVSFPSGGGISTANVKGPTIN